MGSASSPPLVSHGSDTFFGFADVPVAVAVADDDDDAAPPAAVEAVENEAAPLATTPVKAAPDATRGRHGRKRGHRMQSAAAAADEEAPPEVVEEEAPLPAKTTRLRAAGRKFDPLGYDTNGGGSPGNAAADSPSGGRKRGLRPRAEAGAASSSSTDSDATKMGHPAATTPIGGPSKLPSPPATSETPWTTPPRRPQVAARSSLFFYGCLRAGTII